MTNPKILPITVPELGSETNAARVTAWLVDVGQVVVAGECVVELLVPGVTFDVQTERTGQLVSILKPVDTMVKPGEIVGLLEV